MDYLTYLDLHKNELRNAVMHPLAVAPSSPVEGQFYYNSADKKAYQYNGTAWVLIGELNIIESIVVNGTALTPSNKAVSITIPTDLGDLTNEAGYIKQADIPEGAAASSTTPTMNGTAAAGSETAFARGDHVHPTDTSRLAANLKGAAGGVAELDQNGKVPSSQLPSYVDDIIEGYFYDGAFYEEDTHTTEITGESGKIYSDLATNKLYRWGGSAYGEISASLALGETSATAYRGDRGKTAYDHSQVTSGNPHNVTASDVGLGNVDNTSDATKKTNFTGAIAAGDTGFVTGGDAHTAIAAADKVFFATFNTTVDELVAAYRANKLIWCRRHGMDLFEVNVLDVYESGIFVITFASVIHSDSQGPYYYECRYTYSTSNNISEWDDNLTKKTLAQTGYVDSAVAGLMKSATGTIATNATSATVNYTGTLVNAYATMGGEIVELDKAVTSSSVTFSTAQTPSYAVTCTVIYF